MCAAFSGRLNNTYELAMHFSTSTFNTAQTCSCTFESAETCQTNGDITSNDCLLSDDIRASVNFVDNGILSCERGHIQASLYDPYNRAINYNITTNQSDIRYTNTAKIEYSLTQYSAYGNAHMEGNFSLISK